MAFEILKGPLPAQTAGGATSVTEIDDVPTGMAEQNWNVQNASLTSPTLVTGAATNNVTFNFRNVRAGAVVGTFATLTLASGTNLAAETEVNVPVSSGAVQAGDTIDVQMVQVGTGLAVPAGVLAQIEIA